jgi:hypothetical protein
LRIGLQGGDINGHGPMGVSDGQGVEVFRSDAEVLREQLRDFRNGFSRDDGRCLLASINKLIERRYRDQIPVFIFRGAKDNNSRELRRL